MRRPQEKPRANKSLIATTRGHLSSLQNLALAEAHGLHLRSINRKHRLQLLAINRSDRRRLAGVASLLDFLHHRHFTSGR